MIQQLTIRHSEKGAVLIVGLMLLLVMTILGVSGMSNTTLQERMAGNTRQKHIAEQAAEVALREAEQELLDAQTALDIGGTSSWRGTDLGHDPKVFLAMFDSSDASTAGLFSRIDLAAAGASPKIPSFADSSTDSDWSGGDTKTITNTISNLTQQPVYIIEYVGYADDANSAAGAPLDPNASTNAVESSLHAYAFRITAFGWGQGATPTSRYMLQSHFRLTN